MNKGMLKTENFARKVVIVIFAIIGVCVLFGLLLFSVAWLGDVLHPIFSDFAYLVSLIITIAGANFICCKIIKPVCEVKFRDKARADK
jgi:cytochrome c biogenesis protein CcdA